LIKRPASAGRFFLRRRAGAFSQDPARQGALQTRWKVRLHRRGQRALRPFHCVGFHGIDLVAVKALKFRPAGRSQYGFHASVAVGAAIHGLLPVCLLNAHLEQKFRSQVKPGNATEGSMQTAIDRVMHTYGMLVNLTSEQEQEARERVSSFLAKAKTDDENKLAVEGLRYLRESKLS